MMLPQVWDLRARKCVYTIPAHRSLVSSAHYEHSTNGQYIVTGGYDSLVKVCFMMFSQMIRLMTFVSGRRWGGGLACLQVWSAKDFKLLRTLAGHEGKVMAVDSSPRPGSHLLASVSYDRTVKLWAPEWAGEGADAMEEH